MSVPLLMGRSLRTWNIVVRMPLSSDVSPTAAEKSSEFCTFPVLLTVRRAACEGSADPPCADNKDVSTKCLEGNMRTSLSGNISTELQQIQRRPASADHDIIINRHPRYRFCPQNDSTMHLQRVYLESASGGGVLAHIAFPVDGQFVLHFSWYNHGY